MQDLKIDFFSLFMFLGVTQGLFLSLFFLLKKNNEHSLTKLLGIILFLISIQILDFFAAYSLLTLKFPYLLDISTPLTLATGPLFYLIYYYYNNHRLPSNWFLHILPVLIFFVNHLFYFLEDPNKKYNSLVLSRGLELPLREARFVKYSDPLGLMQYGGELIAISLGIYSILMLVELSKIIKKSDYTFWKIGNKTTKWLRDFALLTSGLIFYVIIDQIFIRTPKTEYIIASYLTILTYFISLQLLRNSILLNIQSTKNKYQNSALDCELKELIKARIIKFMENESPYLNNLFSLPQLAKNVSASPNNVSQILNELFNQSFYEFINTYRIKAAEKYLTDLKYSNINIEEIGFKVGFNSKTTFYKAFKKQIGKTPLQFKKQI